MNIGDKVKSKKIRNDHGRIVKIWWDGTIRVQWDIGHHTLCKLTDVVIVNWNNGNQTLVRRKAE